VHCVASRTIIQDIFRNS